LPDQTEVWVRTGLRSDVDIGPDTLAVLEKAVTLNSGYLV